MTERAAANLFVFAIAFAMIMCRKELYNFLIKTNQIYVLNYYNGIFYL